MALPLEPELHGSIICMCCKYGAVLLLPACVVGVETFVEKWRSFATLLWPPLHQPSAAPFASPTNANPKTVCRLLDQCSHSLLSRSSGPGAGHSEGRSGRSGADHCERQSNGRAGVCIGMRNGRLSAHSAALSHPCCSLRRSHSIRPPSQSHPFAPPHPAP